MEYKNLTGWNLGFSEQSEKGDSYDADEVNLTERSEHSFLKVPSGLHCGPAGRRTLIKWLEDNYKLSRGINNANPGVMACRLWQESQGLPDEVSKAIVGLLKLQGIPTNVTYKTLFENYLAIHLSTLMKRHSHSQKKLCLLADKMISMFQVFQIQPLIVDLLDLLIDIPQSAMSKILEDTSSSHNFYKICTPNIKRKIWAASPEKLYETVIPLIYKCLFLLRLGIFDEEMTSASNTENLNEYNMLISHILQLIGDPQHESSRIVYCQVVTILKLLFVKSTLQYKTNFNRNTGVNYVKNEKGGVEGDSNLRDERNVSSSNSNRNANGNDGMYNSGKNLLNISKFIDCNLCFKNESFSEMKNKDLDFHYSKISCEDLCNLYFTYTNKTIGLSYSCYSTISEILSELVGRDETFSYRSSQGSHDGKYTKTKPENQLVDVDIDEDLVYQDRGEHFFSAIRYSLAMKCQEMYKITNADMKLIEPNFNLLQLINKVQNTVDNNLPTNELMGLMNKKNIHNNISIKDDMDLFNISFILCNPILYNRIISYYVYYLFNMDITLLTSKVDINYWLSLILLGLSCSYISIVKFVLDSECRDKVGKEEGRLKCVAYLKPYINVCKPVSLKKLLSYIHPVDKDNKLSTSSLPPFFANFISPTMSQQGDDSNPYKKLSEFDIMGDEVYTVPEDDPDTTFHSLLILYLPKLDTKLLNQFRSSCRNFLNLFHKDTNEEDDEPLDTSRSDVSLNTYSEVDFTKEGTKDLVSKILEPFNLSKFDSNTNIGMLLSILERHYSKAKKVKTSGIGQLNFTLLYIMMKKLSYFSHTTMNVLSSTANITKLLFKLITLELVRTALNLKFHGTRQDSESLLRFISYDRFKKETVVNFKSPTDYSYLRLLRIMMFSDSVKTAKDVVFKFVENVSNYSLATSFILLYYYKKYGKDKNAKQTLERLSRDCHRILYDKENKNNPSYKYRKWTLLFEEMTESLG